MTALYVFAAFAALLLYARCDYLRSLREDEQETRRKMRDAMEYAMRVTRRK